MVNKKTPSRTLKSSLDAHYRQRHKDVEQEMGPRANFFRALEKHFLARAANVMQEEKTSRVCYQCPLNFLSGRDLSEQDTILRNYHLLNFRKESFEISGWSSIGDDWANERTEIDEGYVYTLTDKGKRAYKEAQGRKK